MLTNPLPILYAQAAAATGPRPSPGDNSSMILLAFRRWWSGLTLAPTSLTPDSSGLRLWLAGLAVLLVAALVAQGPRRALGQSIDVAGLTRLLRLAGKRLKAATRLLGFVVGMTVVTWTSNQFFFFGAPSGREDQLLATQGRELHLLGLEQGTLAALTPLRDVFQLCNMIPLLVLGAAALFHFSSDRAENVQRIYSRRAAREPLWGLIAWAGLGLHAVYRLLGLLYTGGGFPLGGCLFVEAGVAPAVMALSDGVVLAWVLVEIRNAGLGDSAAENVDFGGILALLPGTILVCVLTMPARYVSAAVALTLPYVTGGFGGGTVPSGPPTGIWLSLMSYARWQLGPGLAVLQAFALPALPLVGAAAWGRGDLRSQFRGAGRLFAEEGGRLFGLVLICGILTVILAAVPYVVVLAIPTQSWVLTAADAYSHYATLTIGLVLTSGLIELSRRTLPKARPAVFPRANSADSPTANPPTAAGVRVTASLDTERAPGL